MRTARAHVTSLWQPALTLLLTLLVAAFVVVPPALSTSDVTAAATTAADAASSAVQTTGRSLALPGQGSPGDLAPVAGPGMPAGDSRVVRLTVAGRERGYLLLPALGLAPRQLAALVVVLHQDVGSAQAVAEGLGLDSLRRRGVTLAYPAGVGGSWNAGGCCGVAKDQGVDDVAFVDAVLDDVGRHVPIDLHRRALVGYSGGGMLAYRVLCRAHPELVAAVEVSGSLEAHCPSTVVLPDLLSVHGAKDGTVGLTRSIRVTHLGMSPRSVQSTLGLMTAQAKCGRRTTKDEPGVRHVHWRDCRGGSTIDLQIVAGAGHGWESVQGAKRAMPFLEAHLVLPK
ncbi:MAG: polyhydroxybutyrate depolymerase [Actinomycetota bacterium]|jgi:polyhydroxybutyrate depolymerase|nr:polyhydroxybutyrate depolymerase [Actinomycetota bacterium]